MNSHELFQKNLVKRPARYVPIRCRTNVTFRLHTLCLSQHPSSRSTTRVNHWKECKNESESEMNANPVRGVDGASYYSNTIYCDKSPPRFFIRCDNARLLP